MSTADVVNADFGQVRSLLQRPEAVEVWRALFELLDTWPDRQQLEHELIPYAVDILSRWRQTPRPLHRGEGPLGWSFVEERGWVSMQLNDPAFFLLGDTIELGRDFFDYWDDYEYWQRHRYERLQISPAHLSALLGSPHMTTIKRLILRDVFMGEHGAQTLTQSPYLGALEALELDSSYLGADGVRAMGARLRLRDLALHGCVIEAQGLVELSKKPWLKQLERLSLSHDRVSAPALRALLERACDGALTTLELMGLGLDEQGLGEINDLSRRYTALTTLDLRGNRLSANACAAFIVEHRFERLERLVLSCAEERLRSSLGAPLPAWVELIE